MNIKNTIFRLVLMLVLLSPGLFSDADSADSPISVTKLSPRAIVLTFPDDPMQNNIIAIKSEKGIVVVDTHSSPSTAVEIRKKIIEEFQEENFAYVIDTHSHGDHTCGNQVFSDAVIIAHEACIPEMLEYAKRQPQMANRLKSILKQMKAGLEKMDKTSEEAQALERRITYYELAAKETESGFVLTLPEVTFKDRMSLNLGDLHLDLYYFGLCHSKSDILVYCPEEGLLLTGDLFSTGHELYVDSERILHFDRWEKNLEMFVDQDKKINFIISGHKEFLEREELSRHLDFIRKKKEEFKGKSSAFFAAKKIYQEEGLEAAAKGLKEMSTQPQKYYLLYPELDQYVYYMMLDGKLDEAAVFFETLAELFPDKSMAYDSLGEVYKRKGNIKLALKNFKKSLELDPENRNAKMQIDQLEKKK
ncbi:MAG: MBL fold metallo-hydrolase [Candidatus Aminicenantes bacterium]|nr:MBL fold metallo-hydrolase [Candidatus Aminicenantes bacterium]